MKTLYQLAGQTSCHHHITKTAVAAGLITEVKAGTGSNTAFANPRP